VWWIKWRVVGEAVEGWYGGGGYFTAESREKTPRSARVLQKAQDFTLGRHFESRRGRRYVSATRRHGASVMPENLAD